MRGKTRQGTGEIAFHQASTSSGKNNGGGRRGIVRSQARCEFGTSFSSGLEDRTVMIGRKMYENLALIAAPTMYQNSQAS